MANNNTIRLEVIITDNGTIQATGTKLGGLTNKTAKTAKGLSNVANAANKTKRNLEGVSQRAGSTGKDFSRMSQGMGGLVQAYATIAANVFALSSAFLVLRRAADLSSMQKSAENFSDRFGVSVTRLTKRMQELSGGALDFAEALPTINKAVSAGVGIEQMEKLTVAATKASQTFGGSTADALNRFISASQRGRVEIIQTLGVVIKTEQAYKDYAARIGKTAQELTAFDRQQAILNATITESEKVFGAINIDPNPFTQLATTIVDLKNKYLTFLTDAITPGINIFNRSEDAARAFMVVIASAVAGKIFPQLAVMLKGVQAASIRSTALAARSEKAAYAAREKAAQEHAKQIGVISQKGLRKQIMQEEAAYAKRTKMHADFKQSIFTKEGEIDRARLTAQRAALQKQLNAIEKRGGKGSTEMLSKDTRVLQEQIRVRTSLISTTQDLGIAEAKAAAARSAATTQMNKHIATWKSYAATVRATVATIKSNLVTGFSKGFTTMQTNVSLGIKLMYRDWKVFIASIGRDGSNSVKLFSNAFGRAVGTVAGGLSRLLSLGSSLLLWWSLYNLAVEVFGDKIKGITPEQRKLLDTFQDSGEALEEIVERNKNFIAGFNKSDHTVSNFIKTTEYLRGTMDSLKTAFNDVTVAFNRAFGIERAQDLVGYIKGLETAANKLTEFRAKGVQGLGTEATSQALTSVDIPGYRIPKESINAATAYNEKLDEMAKSSEAAAQTLANVNNIISEMAQKFIPQVISGLSSTTNALNVSGFEGEAQKIQFALAMAVDSFANAPKGLAEAFASGNFIGAQAVLEGLAASGEEGAKNAAILLAKLSEFGGRATESSMAVFNNFVGFSRSLETINSNMGTYLSGIEKAKAASVPNKESLNFILDTRVALEGLRDTAKGTSNSLKSLVTASDLESLRLFFNLSEGVQTYEQALAVVVKEQEKYNQVVIDSITKANIFKGIANQVEALKLSEAATDDERIEKLRTLFDLESERLDQTIRMLENSKKVAISEVRRLERANQLRAGEATDNIAILQAREEVAALELEITSTMARRYQNTVKKELETARELLEIRRESLEASKGVLSAQTQILQINRSFSRSMGEALEYSKQIYRNEKLDLRLKERSIQLEIEGLPYSKLTLEQQEKKRAVYNAQLSLLKEQTKQLDLQQEARLALELERSGTTVFTKDGLRASAHFFARELQSEISKLKSTFEILGRGLAGTIIGAFDTAIDNLLEGGHEFGKTVREGLKASLREVFGNALKEKIKESIIDAAANIPLFDKLFVKEDPADQYRKESLSKTSTIIEKADRQISLLESIDRKTPEIPGATVAPGAAPAAQSIINNVLPGAATVNDMSINAIKSVSEQIKTGNSIAKDTAENTADKTIEQVKDSPSVAQNLAVMGTLITASQADSKSAVVSALFTIASQIIAAQQASGGGSFLSTIGSFFGYANGGIMPGSFKALEYGGVVRSPTMGLVGEGKNHEAVVPLPNNREIPVELRGSGGDTINIEQNFDFRNADTSAIPVLRAEARAIEERTFNRVFSEINKGGRYAKMTGRR